MEGRKSDMGKNKVHVKRDDTVIVLSGKDKGKKGKVIQVAPKEGKVIVEGINMVSKHVKPKSQEETGGIIKGEGAMYACKVQLLCKKCNKPARTGHAMRGDKKIRVCKRCNEEI